MIDSSQRRALSVGCTPPAAFADPKIWRWYADLLSERRLACEHDGTRWVVAVDGRRLADARAFETAVHSAYAMTRALSALDRARAA